MKQSLRSILVAFGIAVCSTTAFAQAADSMHGSMMHQSMMHDSMSMHMMHDPMVGGAAMSPQKNIIQNAVNSNDHTTLVAAVKAAGLVKALSGPGPFTVFAPTNEAFAALPSGTVPMLLKPKNKMKLTAVLTYHVVSGRLDSKALMAKIHAHGGKAMLKTLDGEMLTVTAPGMKMIDVTDSKGRVAKVTIADVYQSNGVIHVINKVLLP